MREVIKYEAFDGVLFDTKALCEKHEVNHILFNPHRIKFYSLNGKKIKGPSESVLIDANRFIAWDAEALATYQAYCSLYGLSIPESPTCVGYPLHYVFNSGWVCIEDTIEQLYQEIENFSDEYEENEEDHHNLADCG